MKDTKKRMKTDVKSRQQKACSCNSRQAHLFDLNILSVCFDSEEIKKATAKFRVHEINIFAPPALIQDFLRILSKAFIVRSMYSMCLNALLLLILY